LTSSIDFPTTNNAFHNSFLGGVGDGFVAIINPGTGQLTNSTYLGTSTDDIAQQVQIDDSGNVYVMGQCSGDYDVSQNVYFVPFGHTFIDKLSPDLSSSLLST